MAIQCNFLRQKTYFPCADPLEWEAADLVDRESAGKAEVEGGMVEKAGYG